MITAEETKVLSFLRRHLTSSVDELAASCLAGSSPDWVDRVLSNLEWFGHVIVYRDRAGNPLDVQITEKGMGQFGGASFSPLAFGSL